MAGIAPLDTDTLSAAATRADNAETHAHEGRLDAAREDALDAFRLLGEFAGLDRAMVAACMRSRQADVMGPLGPSSADEAKADREAYLEENPNKRTPYDDPAPGSTRKVGSRRPPKE